MNENITGEALDSHLKLIEEIAADKSDIYEILDEYTRHVKDRAEIYDVNASHTVAAHATYLVHTFVGILNRQPEVGAFRYYLPNLIWGTERWPDRIRQFLELPEVRGRYSDTTSNHSRLCPHVLEESVTVAQNLLIKMVNISDVTGQRLDFHAATPMNTSEIPASFTALRDTLLIINDIISQKSPADTPLAD